MIEEKNKVAQFLQDLQDGAQRPPEAAERLPEPFENLQVPGTVLVRDRVQRASEGIHTATCGPSADMRRQPQYHRTISDLR